MENLAAWADLCYYCWSEQRSGRPAAAAAPLAGWCHPSLQKRSCRTQTFVKSFLLQSCTCLPSTTAHIELMEGTPVWTLVSMVIHAHIKKPVLFFFFTMISSLKSPPLPSEMAQTCEISHMNVLNVTPFRSDPIIPHICWNLLM